jgi:hypothetical protein
MLCSPPSPRRGDGSTIFGPAALPPSPRLQFGKKVHQDATYKLYAAVTSGMRSGAAGEPFPRDLATKEHAEKMMKGLSSFAAEYEFYELIKKDAERKISWSLEQAELLKAKERLSVLVIAGM